MSNSLHNAVPRLESGGPGESTESLGAQVLALLSTLRTHSVSIFDGKGNVQWLSEGALGPDEQLVVEDAVARLTAITTRAHFDAPLANNRAALFLAVRTPGAQLAGLVMVLMDAKTLHSGNPAARILTTRMRAVLQKIAIFLAPPQSMGPAGVTTGSDLPIRAVLEILEPGDVGAVVLPEPPVQSRVAAPALRLRELIRLRPGARTRRYQIVPVAEEQRGDALETLKQLLAWLEGNPAVLQADPLSFTIGVSAQALSDPELPAALTRMLGASAVEPEMIGFELREAACVQQRAQAEAFIGQCGLARCFVVIDDFTFDTAALDLLRSHAVRLLKVETRLVATAMRDKLSQARVVAIAQAAKVLGTHCAAKYVDSQTGRQWLTGVGFDFTQSSTLEPLARLAD